MSKFFINDRARTILLSMRKRPGMFLEKNTPQYLQQFWLGCKCGMSLGESNISLIPDKFFQINNNIWYEMRERGLDGEEGFLYFFEKLDDYLERYGMDKIKEKLTTYEDYLLYLSKYHYLGTIYLKELNEILHISSPSEMPDCIASYVEKQEQIRDLILRGNIHCHLHGTDILFCSPSTFLEVCIYNTNYICSSSFEQFLKRTPYLDIGENSDQKIAQFFCEMCENGQAQKDGTYYLLKEIKFAKKNETQYKSGCFYLAIPKNKQGIADYNIDHISEHFIRYKWPEKEYRFLEEKKILYWINKTFQLSIYPLGSEILQKSCLESCLEKIGEFQTELPVFSKALKEAIKYNTFLGIDCLY